jgi:hypothetical protein
VHRRLTRVARLREDRPLAGIAAVIPATPGA